MEKSTLTCTFETSENDDGDEIYECFIENQQVPENVKLLFQGQHLSGKNDNDVTSIVFTKSPMKKIPQISKTFKNIKSLNINSCELKSVTKFDLKQFPQLSQFGLKSNKLEFIPSDLFEFTRNLTEIYFQFNSINFIGSKVFENLPNLVYLSILRSGDLDVSVSYSKSKNNMEEVNKTIIEKMKPPVDEREMIEKYGRDPDGRDVDEE